MERGSDKHGAMRDEQLESELSGMLGQAGGHREDWREPEFPADDADDATAAEAGLVDQQQNPSAAEDPRSEELR